MGVLIGKVVSVDDDSYGGRIKVRIAYEDSRQNDEDLPYAFPLLPKLMHVRPKEGEAVFVLTADDKNAKSQRYYIGPLISQPQYLDKDYAEHSSVLLRGGVGQPSRSVMTDAESIGSYPNNDDVAIVGRRNSEIVLRENKEQGTNSSEIDIRCGVRVDRSNNNPARFNQTNPAYIQVKFQPSPLGTDTTSDNGNSTVNIVADQINLISPKSISPAIEPIDKTDDSSLINDKKFQKIIDECHTLPYGDELVKFLNLFRDAFNSHTHKWVGAGQTPVPNDSYKSMNNYPLSKMLSKNVRIN